MRRRWRGQLYATGYSAFARGALMWVRPDVPFAVTQTLIDVEGRYVIIQGTLDGRHIILASLYAPNVDQANFLNKVTNILAPWHDIPMILGGTTTAYLMCHLIALFLLSLVQLHTKQQRH